MRVMRTHLPSLASPSRHITGETKTGCSLVRFGDATGLVVIDYRIDVSARRHKLGPSAKSTDLVPESLRD